jgi:hypothetical protein
VARIKPNRSATSRIDCASSAAGQRCTSIDNVLQIFIASHDIDLILPNSFKFVIAETGKNSQNERCSPTNTAFDALSVEKLSISWFRMAE